MEIRQTISHKIVFSELRYDFYTTENDYNKNSFWIKFEFDNKSIERPNNNDDLVHVSGFHVLCLFLKS